MDIEIEYCVTCNYRPIAASLALAIKAATGVMAMLVPSREAGAYEIKADGRLIFSKKKTGSFPKAQEIIELLAVRPEKDN